MTIGLFSQVHPGAKFKIRINGMVEDSEGERINKRTEKIANDFTGAA